MSPQAVPIRSGDQVVAAPVVVVVTFDEAKTRWRDRLTGRCTPNSAARMLSVLERVAECSGWRVVPDVDFSSADAFLSARRRGDNGSKWAGTTHDQAVSVLKTFGEFMRKSGMVKANPLLDLEPCGEKGGDGARPLTADQARSIIAHSIDRHMVSRRAKGCAPLFWLTLMYTGLRYSEGQSMRWENIVEDGVCNAARHNVTPGVTGTIITDPKWEGNKSGDKDEIPIRADLYRLLLQHRETVPNSPEQLVFPKAPTRLTWQAEREAAGIPLKDPRTGNCTPHSCRKSFCTWLDAQSIPRGLVSHLARHAATLAEGRYIRHNQEIARAAVEGLPLLWPSGVEIFSIRRTKKLAPSEIVPDTASATPVVSPMCYSIEQLVQTDGPVMPLGSGVAIRPHGPGPSVPSSLSNQPRSSSNLASSFSHSIECGNGQVRTQSSALNQSDLPEQVVRVLTAWLDRQIGAAPKEPSHARDQQDRHVG